MSNEKEIREDFKKLLSKNFPNGFTFDEFSGGGLVTRPDLATFLPNDIIFTEIKSDKDTFSRLDNQVMDYLKYANFVYIVLDIKHLPKFQKEYKKRLPKGQVYFYKEGYFYHPNYINDNLTQKVEELAYYSYPTVNINILSFLWKAEMYPFTGFIKGRTKILSDFLVIQHLYTAREIIDMCHYILYDRAKNRANSESGKLLTYNHGWYDKKILHTEHRQSLFDNIECERAVKRTKKTSKGLFD